MRGRGALVAASFDEAADRDAMVKSLHEQKLMALPCGTDSIRFRPALSITEAEVDLILEKVAAAVATV